MGIRLPESRLIVGNCLEVLPTLPEGSVHCCVTSPPYWGLRDYHIPAIRWADGTESAFGLEATPELYLAHAVLIFREVRRVLREDGTLWLNIGDSYSSKTCSDGSDFKDGRSNRGCRKSAGIPDGLKPKSMVGIPWRLALALQADGWILRQDIIWHKPNPMPEAVQDRCTKAHEYLFILTKSPDYFWDKQAMQERVNGLAHARAAVPPPAGWGRGDEPRTAVGLNQVGIHRKTRPGVTPKAEEAEKGTKANASFSGAIVDLVTSRNRRSVWTIPTMPYRGKHFATFPPDLVKPCILAGTSARGCCPNCGAPWERIIEDGEPDLAHQRACGGDRNGEYSGQATKDYEGHRAQNASEVKARILRGMIEKKTIGWQPTCDCPAADPIPCTVLDPFAGTGTTGKVAIELGRDAVLIEASEEYAEQAEIRTAVTPGLAL